jgi:hypothetical protein
MSATWYDRALDGALGRLARVTGARRVWHRWPFPIAVPIILGHRVNLRHGNLVDTEPIPPAEPPQLPPGFDPHEARTPDGSFNDLSKPWMGMRGARFGRNVRLESCWGEMPPGIMDPSPRVVSNKLMARREFVPVPHLNVLAAAWIQFMVHDWLSHGPNVKAMQPHRVPLPPGDDWPGGEMTVLPTLPDPRRGAADDGRPLVYTNVETAWWDGSQIYGSWLERQQRVRADPASGKLLEDGKIGLENGMLPVEGKTEHDKVIPNLELAGVNGNWWVGLSVLHTLFAREHNAIVDRLRAEYPRASGEWLFQKARLANAALMAKIHTVEWTPALMDSPEGRTAMRGNFWGIMGERFGKAFGRVGRGEVLSGIPGSAVDHHGAPYAMTEEFAAVYRLHSLMPDEFSFRSHDDDGETLKASLAEVAGGLVRNVYARVPFEDVAYSLGTSHPGALVLHNFPNVLRKLDRNGDGTLFFDMAAIDVLRDRERGVPRYCAFRRCTGMPAPKSFEELTDDKDWQRELREVYGDIEKVDLLVGTLAEAKCRNGTPPRFGFSDTAFRIFILMASRRLKSDRFYCEDFRPEVYTPAGFAWVQENSFRTVLERHLPELRHHFADARNVFFPWARAGA